MANVLEQNQIRKILCVDDEKNILESLKRSLRCSDYEILIAETPILGLEIVKNQTIDLIITDLCMPLLDGVEFLSQVREIHKNIPSILLTGFPDQESTIRAINDGHISAYVSKPWENSDLKIKVASLLKIACLEKEQKRLLVLTHKQNKQLQEWNKTLEVKVNAKVSELQDAESILDAAYDELTNSYDSVVKLLSQVICANEHMISKNNTTIPKLAKSLAEKSELSSYLIKQVYFSALLFELGKLSLPLNLLMKPEKLLSIADFKEFMAYPEIGANLLEDVPNFHATSQIIKHHCEYIDGSGLPYGLKNDDIPIGSRILCIVKDYYLLLSGRYNGVEHSTKNALKFLHEREGKLYDKELVDLLSTCLVTGTNKSQVFPETALTSKQLQNGMILSKECSNGKGLVLLEKGTEINDEIIQKLATFEKVYDIPLQFFVCEL